MYFVPVTPHGDCLERGRSLDQIIHGTSKSVQESSKGPNIFGIRIRLNEIEFRALVHFGVSQRDLRALSRGTMCSTEITIVVDWVAKNSFYSHGSKTRS